MTDKTAVYTAVNTVKEDTMEKLKKILNKIFIDGLSGMATGLFATLIIGTIISQIGSFIPGNIGTYIYMMGKVASSVTGAGIGVGVALKYKESPLVVISAATAGMMGAFASKILAGTVLVDGVITYAGPGEPLGAFIAALVAILIGHLRASDLCFYGIYRTACQCECRGTSVYRRYYRFCFNGYYPDTADQLRSTWHYLKSVRSGSRCGNGWMLL